MKTYPMNYRRVRLNKARRDLFSEVTISPNNLIMPYFIYEGLDRSEDLTAIYGQKKHTIDSLLNSVEVGLTNGIKSVLLFIIPKEKRVKDFDYSFDSNVINSLKTRFGEEITIGTDICLCSNTHTGHCGFLNSIDQIDNSSSVNELVKKAVSYANAGADLLSPSDMMDDRIFAIRKALDENGLNDKMIMSYSTKFSSNFYGPFRSAAESTPTKGDRKSYQIDYRNIKDAIRCSVRDVEQGADILMVKPAGAYLDIIYRIKNISETSFLPLCAYQVSGEYQGLYIMANQGILDFKMSYYESLVAIKRAGADLIITYGANDFKNWFNNL